MIKDAVIPRYTISQMLSENRNVRVYRATDDSGKGSVIIKSVASEHAGTKEAAKLSKEYKVLQQLGQLNIPGVNRVIELVISDNVPSLVMEDIGAISLSDYICDQQIDLRTFLEIAGKIAYVLSCLHAENIMHKNINPDNIIINPQTREVRIIDFSISARLSRERTALRNPNILEGSLAYISPEQTGRMNRVTDYRSDLYSLGITFYKMLVGHLPFKSDDAMEMIHCHLAKKIQSLTDTNASIPKAVSDIILKLTSKIADDRYQSAIGLKYDLDQCLAYLTEMGRIPDFPVGQKDVFSKFKIPEKLYGREKEIENLLNAFHRVSNGSCKLTLVSGFSGIGKSSLVNEMHKASVQKGGHFISGKNDQFKANIPFYAFRSAFSDLLKYLVSEPRQKLDKIKSQLIEALGFNASILVDLIPEFELIVGNQTAAVALNPSESQNRLYFALHDFLHVFCSREHPLTIFLDDLQWCDDASLNLVKELVVKEIPYLMIIGAYRQNEVNAGHPLSLTIEAIKKQQRIQEIFWHP